MIRRACIRAGLALSVIATSCNRPGIPDPRVLPLDPQAVARADAASHAGPSVAAPLPTATYLLHPSAPTDMPQLARALERRARGLDAAEARATVRDDRVELRVTFPLRGGMNALFGDQVQRRGLLTIAALDPACDPFARMPLPPGITHQYEAVDWSEHVLTFAYAHPMRSTGAAPLAPMQRLVAATQPPPGRAILIGASRDYSGETGRRTYCVETRDAMFGPRVRETETTLDPRTLYPLLRLHLDAPEVARITRLRTRAQSLVIAIDDEVIGRTDGHSPRGDDWLDVVPSTLNSSVSPEMVTGLLAGGVLPVPVTLVMAAN